MKTAIKIGIFILALLIMVVPAVACGESTVSLPENKITIADAPVVLDMSSELPATFEHLDAASEGMSNLQLGLGPDFSEVELFLSEEPYQVVFTYLCIIESRVERATSDAFMRNEEQIRSVVLTGLQAGAAQEGFALADIQVQVQVTNPDLGDLAVLGSGTFNVYGFSLGYDVLLFKSNKVYVFIFSTFLPGEGVSLIPLAEGVEQRIGMFSQ